MIIRHFPMLAILLVALSACKAVTLEEATVTQPTFGIEAEDWGVPATDELRQDAYHAPTPTTHPTAAVINTQDLHAMLIGPNPPVTINAVFGKNQVTSIPGSIWLTAAGQGGTFDDDIPNTTGVPAREPHRQRSRTTDRGLLRRRQLLAVLQRRPASARARLREPLLVSWRHRRVEGSKSPRANDHGVQAIEPLAKF